MAHVDTFFPDISMGALEWINHGRDESLLYRGSLESIRHNIRGLLLAALDVYRAARESHEAYKESFARTIDEMRRLRTMAMEADEIPKSYRNNATTLADRYVDEFNNHARYMRTLLRKLFTLSDGTDFLCATLFVIHIIVWEGDWSGYTITNLANALKAVDASLGQTTEEHLSDVAALENVWPVSMQRTVSDYYDWTRTEAQEAMSWTDEVLVDCEALDWTIPSC